jgi:RNA polymerase sigma-70 factor (ECF subfamily)
MAIEASTTPSQPMDEQALLAGARSDDRAFGKLYERHMPRIYEFFARRIEDREAAENLTAATFQRALGAIRAGEVGGSLTTFLYQVAGSAVVDHARRRRKPIPKGVRASDHDGPGDREAAEAIANEFATRAFAAAIDDSRLRRAFTRLADEDRHLIVLRYFDGLEIDDLCAVTGQSRQALTVRLHHALRALRSALAPEAGAATEAIDAA